MIELSGATAPPSPPAAEAHPSWPAFQTPRSRPGTHWPGLDAGPGADTKHGPGIVGAPANPDSVTALTSPVIGRPVSSAPPAQLSPDASASTRPGERRQQKTARSSRKFAHVPWLFLIAILTVQAVLSLRLIWTNTAFLDEATYLFGGHVEIEHWLHGTPVPAFAAYFSGAPVIYPPLAALTASIGGLAAARLLSMAFMLGATGLLWSTTSKLFGKQAALYAATLFAVIGPTQTLGAFATYDAMALFLLAASAWCIVSARDRDDSTLFLIAGILFLGLANSTKYATALFDPTVVALAAIIITERHGWKPALARGGYVAAGTLGLVSALLALGGPWYITGILSTTLSRATGSKSALLVLSDAWKWSGLVCLIGGIGVICALRRRDSVQAMTLAVLAASGMLVPLDQARIHTTTSLFKQVDLGAWFAAAAAGYALTQFSGLKRRTWIRAGAVSLACAVAAVFAGVAGRTQAISFFQGWPDSAQTTAVLRSLTQSHPGNYLAEDYNVPAYYLEGAIPWQHWSQTWYFKYTRPGAHNVLHGAAAYKAAINDGYFSLVILNFIDTAKTDSQIIADMDEAGTYHLVAVVPTHDRFGKEQVMVWAYGPEVPPEGQHGNR